MRDIYALQVNAKDKVKQFLKNTDRLPKELIFIGRNLNLIRSNNKALGSPVNRVNLMAHYAAKSLMWRDTSKMRLLEKVKCIVGDVYGYSVFQSTLFASSLSFYGNRFIQRVYEYLTGKRGLGHEDVLDQVAMMSMRKFGLQVDESSFNA
jgi:aarF domain-containing kinase